MTDDEGDTPAVLAPRRIEILTGGVERRRWPDALKAKIVAESFAPGVVVTELARRYGAMASQVHAWRKAAREGRLELSGDGAPMFAQVVVAAPSEPKPKTPAPAGSKSVALIEIEGDGVQVRVRTNADPALVHAIVRALKGRS
jgi:transposase